jgi:hypothetical protein
MKKYYLTILFPLLFGVNACNDRYEPPKQVDPKEFNEKIENGVQAKAEWVKTPQSIVKELLPKTAFPQGNTSYTVEEKRLSANTRKFTITEEGPFDDEVKGEKTIIDFKSINDKWVITEMSRSLKRRY